MKALSCKKTHRPSDFRSISAVYVIAIFKSHKSSSEPMETVSTTVELLRLLGTPFVPATQIPLRQDKLKEFYRCAKSNRMLLFYLEALRMNKLQTLYLDDYEKENTKYLKTDDSIARASSTLQEAHIKHAVFKTIRPYKSATVDIDIIVFQECLESARAMQKAGYRLVVQGPRSITLWDQVGRIGIDLYEEIAVSSMIYMNKRKLASQTAETKLSNGVRVKTLNPEADLACIIAHSVIKEQIYTLSEYFTFIYYLKQMDVDRFIQFVRLNNLVSAIRVHAGITALLHRTAHGETPEELGRILEDLDGENFETGRIRQRGFKTPHKYHPVTIAKSLLEITKEIETRKSIAVQIVNMFRPEISADFLRKALDHIRRGTY